MMSPVAIRDGTLQVTIVLLVAGLLLVGVSLLGVGASLLLVAGLVVLGAALVLARPDDIVGRVLGVDVDMIIRWLWLAPPVAAVSLLVRLSATPGEVQAIGGLLGLAGMANYFLRPLYLLGYDIARKLAAAGGVGSR